MSLFKYSLLVRWLLPKHFGSTIAELTGSGVNALLIPAIVRLFENNMETFVRRPGVKIQARRATLNGPTPDNTLITYVTDHKGRLLKETVKKFQPSEIADGIIILKYPNKLNCRGNYYNEWYVTESEWTDKYMGVPGTDYAPFGSRSKKAVTKHGIIITPEVIKLLGGSDGRAEISPPWGGTMWALLGGLLTKDGSAIAPQILQEYFYKLDQGPVPEVLG